jgi:hypothetical protein
MMHIIVLEIGAVAVMHRRAVELGEDADGFQGLFASSPCR